MDKDIVYVLSTAFVNRGPLKLDPKLSQKVTVYNLCDIIRLPTLPSLPITLPTSILPTYTPPTSTPLTSTPPTSTPPTSTPPTSTSLTTTPTHPIRSPLDRLYYRNLMDSFQSKWTYKHISPKELADAGFYYLGPRDKVRCLFCSVEIDQWESKQDIVAEHKLVAPTCIAFNKNKVYDVCGPYNLGSPNLNLNGDINSQFIKNFLDSDAVHRDRAFRGNKSMASIEDRLKTFNNTLMKDMNQDIRTFCEAGFIYSGTGNDDLMVCFCCLQRLSNWGPEDDPWIEHAIWAPHCRYLLLMKGKQFVEETCIQNGRDIKNHIEQDRPDIVVLHEDSAVENNATNTVERNTEQTGEIDGQHERSEVTEGQNDYSGLTNDPFDKNFVVVPYHLQPKNVESKYGLCESSVGDLPKEQNTDPTTILCKICLKEKLETMFMPCGHAIACVQCAVTLDYCGVCRFPTEITMRIFPYLAKKNEKYTGTLECLSPQQDVAPVDPMICKVCYKQEMTIAFLPCKHVCTCFECATRMKECPVCFEPYFALLQVFL